MPIEPRPIGRRVDETARFRGRMVLQRGAKMEMQVWFVASPFSVLLAHVLLPLFFDVMNV